jgi:sterol desaturase/sphingolipid hydroxylase (fatty acid hydroxylase superfamily)
LYWYGIKANLIHFLFIGPFAYAVAVAFVTKFVTPWPMYISLPGLLVTQATGYALGHRFMHKKENYWMHKPHHQYNELTFVRPISANAVTMAEFSFAYASPILTGAILFRPDTATMFVATLAISMTNLMIHTDLELLPMAKYLPSFLITNEKHFSHHQKNQKQHYSAPILDLDYILGIDHDDVDNPNKSN